MTTRPATVRRLGVVGATGIGVGSMLGAGVFVVWAPAAQAAGSLLIVAVVLAGVVATCNALSTAQLATQHPVAGGAYTYGRLEVHPAAGYLAGLGFVVGKTASVAAMGLAIGAYAWPGHAPLVATAAIALTWLLNFRGVTRTATAATVIAIIVVAALVAFMAFGAAAEVTTAGFSWPATEPWWAPAGHAASGAALVFFAFAGYARIATLGEEVERPRRTIPLAIVIALAIVLALYVALAVSLMRKPGLASLTNADAPVAALVDGSAIPGGLVAAVAALAAFGAMVALAAGVGRTAMAMAREGDLPRVFARQGASAVPWLAEAVVAAVAITLAWLGNLGFAVAMSSFAVLTYYAVANLAAMLARRAGHTSGLVAPRIVPMVGLAGCVGLALWLPLGPSAAAVGLGLVALALRWFARWLSRTREALREARG